jgi:rhamnosyl/mannosyltransferase
VATPELPPGDGNGPPRVCHLGKFYPPATGGIETHVRALARAQADLGADVRVLCVNHRDRRGRDVTWERFASTPTVEERDGPVRLTRLGRRASLARLDLCPRLLPALAGLGRGEYDILHLHAPNPTMLLALAALRPRAPLVVTYHSYVVKQRALRLAIRPFEHAVYRRAAVLLSDSPTYSSGSPLLGHYRSKLAVLPLGLDLTPYLRPSPAAVSHARELRARHGEPLWLAVGRLVYYKGLHNAVRALPAIPGTLLVIGHGPLEEELKSLAREAGVAERVVWQGRASDDELAGAYHAATALLFPSNARSEGFGLVQVEAMASGCPVINCAIPDSGVAWVSPHEETGLTVSVDDPAALAAAARRLLSDPGLRERLARQARERATREFDRHTMAARSLEIYRRALSRGGRPS